MLSEALIHYTSTVMGLGHCPQYCIDRHCTGVALNLRYFT